MVENCLTSDPEARNSDITLTIALWKRYFPLLLIQSMTGEWNAPLRNLYELPSQDSIKRVRAEIQNVEHRLLPITWEVAKKRQINEELWREVMGYNNPARG
jgi:hypothetical protein